MRGVAVAVAATVAAATAGVERWAIASGCLPASGWNTRRNSTAAAPSSTTAADSYPEPRPRSSLALLRMCSGTGATTGLGCSLAGRSVFGRAIPAHC